jgi:hypothetical protein
MPITQADIETFGEALGAQGQSGQSSPNGRNLVGALNQLQRIAADMDEYGLTLEDLPAEKQAEFQAAHEDFQHYVELLSRLLQEDVAGSDDSIELPNGKTVDLPKQATARPGQGRGPPDSN